MSSILYSIKDREGYPPLYLLYRRVLVRTWYHAHGLPSMPLLVPDVASESMSGPSQPANHKETPIDIEEDLADSLFEVRCWRVGSAPVIVAVRARVRGSASEIVPVQRIVSVQKAKAGEWQFVCLPWG